jgi:hypothetical protein
MMTTLSDKSFTRIVITDVMTAHKRVEKQDTLTHRRELVRSVFAAIEGLHWQLKQDVLQHPTAELSPHERAAMAEETYNVDERGNVNAMPRFLPLTTAIRLVVQMVQRYRPTYTVDYGRRGWADLKTAIEIRNRLAHPKTLEDLSVSDKDIDATMSGFYWVLALVVEILRENNEDLKDIKATLRDYFDKEPN